MVWAVLLLLLVAAAASQDSPPGPAGQQTTDSDSPASDAPSFLPHSNDRFWVSGQANFVFQIHPPFYAKYSGPNSFHSQYEKATSRLLTLYTGLRLNRSAEVLFDLEETGGRGLSDALGLAGFTNLDVVRNPDLGKAPYVARVIFHYVLPLSADKVENERSPLSIFPELPRRRLELRAGKFSVVDFFDLNTVGSDSHFQFMNWTIDNNGAYDYPADTRGYTWGVVAEFHDRRWALRAAEALMPTVANGIHMVWNLRRAHGESYEFMWKRALLRDKPGAIRLLGFSNLANMGIYRDAVAQYLAGNTLVPNITAHPLQQTRKYGFGLNMEQSLNSYLTAFGRFGWNNGKTESYVYSEVDQTVSGGLGMAGSKWRRKADRAGVAFVSNGISRDHQRYLQLGGLGFLLGDGGLHYGRETIFETYYTAHLWKGLYAAPMLQHINNPGYNRDRGPITVPGLRMHAEF